MNSPAYFTGIDQLMRKEKPEAWRNYLAWQVLAEHSRRQTLPTLSRLRVDRERRYGDTLVTVLTV